MDNSKGTSLYRFFKFFIAKIELPYRDSTGFCFIIAIVIVNLHKKRVSKG